MKDKNQSPYDDEDSRRSTPSVFSLRNPTSRKSPQRNTRGSPTRIKRTEATTETVTSSRKSPVRAQVKTPLEDIVSSDRGNETRTRTVEVKSNADRRRESVRKSKDNSSSDGYDGYDDQDESEDEMPKEKKTRKSPRKTKRKVNKWAEMIGYITNSVAAEVGYPLRAEEFMTIIRKNYPGSPPEKKKIPKDVYRERAKQKLQILKEADPSLVDKANKSIKEIMQELKKRESGQ